MPRSLVKIKKNFWIIATLCTVILSIGTFFIFLKSNQKPANPNWMLEQVLEDLSPYSQKKVSPLDITLFFRENPHLQGLFLVHIQGKNIQFQPLQPEVPLYACRKQAFQQLFQTLAEKHPLPTIDFILSLDDAYECEQTPPVPIFVMAKNRASLGRVLIPDFEACELQNMEKLRHACDRAAEKFPWGKKHHQIFWRGVSTGFTITLHNYRELPRFKLVSYSNLYPWLDAHFTQFVQGDPEAYAAMARESSALSEHISIKKHIAYKYLIDIDGNSCTYSRCRWILLSNSTLLKPASQNIQWYYKTLQPYTHYVPLREDFGDLTEVYQWLVAHDEEAQRIALAGQKLAHSIFSQESIENYFLTLFNEYAKIYGPAKKGKSYAQKTQA